LGVRIENPTGAPLGHICVLDDKPIPDEEPALSIMRMFAVRAASELERLQTEKLQAIMTAELNHRVKNNLAAVLAIADQTLQAARSLPEFGHAVMGRVRSMAIVHEMLAQAVWTGAELSRLIERLGEPYRHDRPQRITLAGEHVMLSADLAPALCMVLHELLTNAAKYGALSVTDGSVAVHWSIGSGDAPPRLHLSWREHDGPPVAPRTHRGVGSGLIERMIPYQLHGQVELSFEPDGVRCEIVVPLQTGVSGRGSE
jgi:two-component sensor histidine kinase